MNTRSRRQQWRHQQFQLRNRNRAKRYEHLIPADREQLFVVRRWRCSA